MRLFILQVTFINCEPNLNSNIKNYLKVLENGKENGKDRRAVKPRIKGNTLADNSINMFFT